MRINVQPVQQAMFGIQLVILAHLSVVTGLTIIHHLLLIIFYIIFINIIYNCVSLANHVPLIVQLVMIL